MMHLERWTRPSNYIGADWRDYYSAGVGQSRDSDALERSNFRSMLARLGGESDTVLVVRENHWAVGWIEWIAIHESDTAALAVADSIIGALEDYPVVDEDDYSELEFEDCAETWQNCYDPRERWQYLLDRAGRDGIREHGGGFRSIMAAVRGDWWSAACVLPCPSDLIR